MFKFVGCALWLLTTASAWAQVCDGGSIKVNAGETDPTFHGDGIVVESQASVDVSFTGALELPGGMWLAVGNRAEKPEYRRAALFARYHADGRLDRDFGEKGFANVWLSFDARSEFTSAGPAAGPVIDSRGRYLLALDVQEYFEGFHHQKIAVVRLLPDGTPDPAFGNDGVAWHAVGTQDIPGQCEKTWGLGLTHADNGDDRYLISGGTCADTPYAMTKGFVMQLDDRGERDLHFGTDGVTVVESYPFRGLRVHGGMIYAGLYSAYGVARITSSGALDSSFGVGGVAEISPPESPYIFFHTNDIVPLGDGSVAIAGTGEAPGQPHNDALLAVVTNDGTRNESFGTQGYVTLDLGFMEDAVSLKSRTDGSYLLVGRGKRCLDSQCAGPLGAFLAHLSRDGELLPTFNEGNIAYFDLTSLYNFSTEIAAASTSGDSVLLMGSIIGKAYLARVLIADGCRTLSTDPGPWSGSDPRYPHLWMSASKASPSNFIELDFERAEGAIAYVAARTEASIDPCGAHEYHSLDPSNPRLTGLPGHLYRIAVRAVFPDSRWGNCTLDEIGYVGTSISGRIRDRSHNRWLEGVLLRVAEGEWSARSDSAGKYQISGLANGTYTVIPTLTGHRFDPPSRTVTLNDSSAPSISFDAYVDEVTPTPTATSTPTHTTTPTSTATPTGTATPTATASPTHTRTPSPTATATTRPTETPSSHASPTPTETASPTSTPEQSDPTPTPRSESGTPQPTATPSDEGGGAAQPTPSPTVESGPGGDDPVQTFTLNGIAVVRTQAGRFFRKTVPLPVANRVVQKVQIDELPRGFRYSLRARAKIVLSGKPRRAGLFRSLIRAETTDGVGEGVLTIRVQRVKRR